MKKKKKKSAKKKTVKRKAVKRKKVTRKKKKTTKRKTVKKKKKVVKKKKPAKKKPAKKKTVKKKKPAKKKPAKKKKSKKKRKPNPAFLKPLNASSNLARVVGKSKITRPEAIKKVWAYIKRKGLQDNVNRRNINIDSGLAPLFGSKKQVSMFDLAKVISKNLSS